MKIYKEICAGNLETWGGAADNIERLNLQEIKQILELLEELYPEGISETELNDFFWFDTDTIADWLGYSNWEELLEDR